MVYARKLLLLRLLCNYAFCITQLAKFDFRCKITTFFSYTQPFERKKMIFQSFQYVKDRLLYSKNQRGHLGLFLVQRKASNGLNRLFMSQRMRYCNSIRKKRKGANRFWFYLFFDAVTPIALLFVAMKNREE